MPFDSLGLDSRLLEGVRDLGFSETRPIQSAVIQLALDGSDLIACAATGTGKTCAFVVPILQRLLTADLAGAPSGKSRVLVLAPTRELASQIADSFDTYFGEDSFRVNRRLPSFQVRQAPQKLGKTGVVLNYEGRAERLTSVRQRGASGSNVPIQ